MKFFRPRIERFEARQLMATDVIASPALQVDSTTFMASTVDVAEQSTIATTSDVGQPVLSNPILDYFTDSVVARSGSVTVIASRAESHVLIVDESNLAVPTVAFRLRLDIGIQDVKVDGQRAIIFGQSSDDHTQVIAIDLSSGELVNRVSYGPGQFSFALLQGADAWVVWNPTINPAINATEQNKLIHLQWTETGLVEKDSLSVGEGTWSVGGDRLILSSTKWQGGVIHDTTIHLYDISRLQSSELATLELKNSYSSSVVIANDGRSASLIRGLGDPLVDPQTSVDLLDLSAGSIRIEKSIILDDWTEVYRHDGDLAVLYGQHKRQLVSIDLRSDVPNQSRQHSWELPENSNTSSGALLLSHGRIGVPLFVFHYGPFFSEGEATSSSSQLADGDYLWVLDPATNEQHILQIGLGGNRFFSLEPGTNRIAMWGASGNFSEFIYGELDDRLEFVKEGEVTERIDRFRDLPVVSGNRLLTAYSDQIAIYDLENAGKNLLVASVPESVTELKAPNHDLRVSKAGTLFQPFDPFDFSSPSSTRIHLVVLEGAPAGVQISDPRTISFSAYSESDKQPVDFDYVISNGISQARGHIHVVFADDPFPLVDLGNTGTDGSIRELGASLRHNAMQPLDVNEDGIVTVIDVLLVINAINDGVSSAPVGAIDTNGDGLLQAIDVLLVVNHLNRDVVAVAEPVASASEGELDAMRAAVLKEDLAISFPPNYPPREQLLVGFEPPVASEPEMVTGVYLTPAEELNRWLQKLEAPSNEFVSQPGLKQYNLGSPKLAVQVEGIVRNLNTNEAVELRRVGRPRDVDGRVTVEIVHGFGTGDGASAFDYTVRKVDGQWQVVGRTMTYIT